jgi:hypothetical protein
MGRHFPAQTKPFINRNLSNGQEPGMMTGIETEVHEIRQQVEEISKKLDILLEERETLGIMKLSEKALFNFLDEEPDLYSINDIKAAYR